MQKVGILSNVGFMNHEVRILDDGMYEFNKWWVDGKGIENSTNKGLKISKNAIDILKKNADYTDLILETLDDGTQLKIQYIDRLQNGNKKYELRFWKDGKDVKGISLTDTEVANLKEMLINENPVEVSPPKETTVLDTINILVSVSCDDKNFKSALEKASKSEINIALIRAKVKKNNKTRVKILENALKKADNKKNTVVQKTPKKLESVKTLDETKKIQLEKFQATGNYTYEECEKKLQSDFEDEDTKYCIVKLRELCEQDADFRNNVMREDRTFEGAFNYMYDSARNGYCYKRGKVSYVPREVGLQLMIDYFNGKEKKKDDKTKKANAS